MTAKATKRSSWCIIWIICRAYGDCHMLLFFWPTNKFIDKESIHFLVPSVWNKLKIIKIIWNKYKCDRHRSNNSNSLDAWISQSKTRYCIHLTQCLIVFIIIFIEIYGYMDSYYLNKWLHGWCSHTITFLTLLNHIHLLECWHTFVDFLS